MKKCAALGPCPAYFLSDGTPLGDAIRARGLNKVTVYSRIRRGLSPDQAVAADPLPKGKRPVYRLKDGRPLARAIRESGVSRRCVYYAVKAGASPDDALGAIIDRTERAARRREFFRARRLGL